MSSERRLNLTIKKIYFDAIASGVKQYEYRNNNDYYKSRFDKQPKILRLHYQKKIYLDCKILAIDIVDRPSYVSAEFVSTPTCYRIKIQPIEKFNGWTNRSTWAAYTWITNDEDIYWEACKYASLNKFDLKKFFLIICETNETIAEDCAPIDEINWEEIRKALADS